MSETVHEREQAVLRSMIPRLEADGYAVFLHPPRDVLPPFLDRQRPDLVAFKGDRKVLLQVARQEGGGAKAERLHKALAAHPDWEFRLVYAPAMTPQDALPSLAKDVVAAELARVLASLDRQETAPALLMAWAALEAAGRRLVPGWLPRPQPAENLVEHLTSDGYITPDEADLARALGRVRDAIAHGYLSLDPGREQVEALVAITRSLLDREDAKEG